jgi:serine protease inhibitor
MKAEIRVTVLAVLSAVLLMSISSYAGLIASDQTVKSFANSSNDLGFRLLGELRKESDTSNIFISPGSIMLALAMTYNGSAGETQEQMRNVLALQGMDIDSVNAAAKRIMSWLEEADTSVQLAIANSIWKNEEFPFRKSFIQITRDDYESDVYPLTTASEINNWVADETKDKIKKIVSQITPDDIMFLINAIYFKGSWRQKFAESATRERDFHLTGNKTIQHPLMERHDKYAYMEDNASQVIKLPYGDGEFAMVVFLPRKSIGIEKFLQEFNAHYWQQSLRYLSEREGTIVLPRYEIEYDVTLNKPLKSLGMPLAFDSIWADFGNMWHKPVVRTAGADSNVYIGEVRHKTYVKVNEEGTEAAAVTSVRMKVMTSSAVVPQPPFEMIVDRPFVCAIVDEQTGMILFVGAIHDPRGDQQGRN